MKKQITIEELNEDIEKLAQKIREFHKQKTCIAQDTPIPSKEFISQYTGIDLIGLEYVPLPYFDKNAANSLNSTIDFLNNYGLNILGKASIYAIKSQLLAGLTPQSMAGHFQVTKPYTDLLRIALEELRPKTNLQYVWPTTSGSQAMSHALSIIINHYPMGNIDIITFKHSFHGRPLINLFTDAEQFQHIKHQKISNFYSLPFPKDEESLDKIVSFLNKYSSRDKIPVLILEAVQGNAGVILPFSNSLNIVSRLVKKYKGHIILDEIQTFSRCSQVFAMFHYNIEQYVDILVIGKALEVALTFYSKELSPQKAGVIGGTFASSNSSILLAYKIFEQMTDVKGPWKNGAISNIDKYFHKLLLRLQRKNTNLITRVSSFGLLHGIELRLNNKKVLQIIQQLKENGLVVGTAGKKQNVIRFFLTSSVETSEMNKAVHILENTLKNII